MGQALYRKYRSKSLGEVVGQQHVTETLQRALEKGRINHAYLFTGPRGVGKTSVARIVAHAINELPYEDKTTHLDIIEIDAASNRRIDDIRDLRDKVHIAPTSAKYKVYIIDEVHMLTGESFNALLKTLEEPPSHVVFILATTEVHKLPATIISRTQRFHFRPASPADTVTHLRSIADKENITISDEALHIIAEQGDGSFRDSVSLLDQLSSLHESVDEAAVTSTLGLANTATVIKLLQTVGSGDTQALQAQVTDLEENGISVSVVTGQLIKALREQSSSDARHIELIDALIDVPRSSQPYSKLLVVLLRTALSFAEPKKVATTHIATTVTAAPSIAATPRSLKDAPKKVAPEKKSATEPLVSSTLPSLGRPLTANDWRSVLLALKDSDKPFFSVLKHASPRFSDQGLCLAFSFKLYFTKLEDARYRAKFQAFVNELGYDCPPLRCVLDKTAIAPKLEGAEAPEKPHESTSSVLELMGGGEVVDAEK